MYNKKIVFISACLGLLLFGIGALTLGSIATDLKAKYRLDELAAGTLFSVLPIGILVGSLLFGPVADRYGYRLLLSGSTLLLSLGFAGLAYAGSIPMLQISILFIGLGGGAINGATTAVVSDISDDQNRGANLSLLAVFFGVGALIMPFILGAFKDVLRYETIVNGVAALAFLCGMAFLFIDLPKPKQPQGFPLAKAAGLLRDKTLLLIGMFLFFQSAVEAIINNWTTSFLGERLGIAGSPALFALSAYVAGMTITRLLMGSLLRNVSPQRMLRASMIVLVIGALAMQFTGVLSATITSLFLLGCGVAACFPIMFGFVGGRFPELSGTAFSIVLVIALIGNMLINYLMGVIVQAFSAQALPPAILLHGGMLTLLLTLILRRVKPG